MVMEKTPGTTPGTLSKFPVFTKAKKTPPGGEGRISSINMVRFVK